MGPKIKYKGVFRDPVRFTLKRVSYALGIRWIVLALVVGTPWSGRFGPYPFSLFWFVARWNLEDTFEEIRAYLGFETQRHWSTRPLERTTSCLFGLFSLVVAMAYTLHPTQLPLRQASWYPKSQATLQ